jgi:hypothetical protein
MGRHSSEQRGRFYLSILGWVLPWALISVVMVATVWFAVDALGGDDVKPGSPSDRPPAANGIARTPSPTPDSEPTTSVAPLEPDEPDTPAKPKSARRGPGGGGREPGLITDGVVVQVLNGTGGIPGAAEAMADRLASLGYEIIAYTDGLTVARTIVYYTGPEDEAAAQALGNRFGWTVEPAAEGLDDAIDLHVVVGPDEAEF